MLSLLIHGALMAGIYAFVLEPAPTKTHSRRSVIVKQAEPDESLFEFPEEIVEPDWTPEEFETPLEPELVEQPLPPMELPPDPPAPEPLDWNPPVDLLARVLEFKRPPAPEPQVVQVTVEAPPPVPVVREPRVLEGDELPLVLESTEPSYPRQALRMGWQGTVCLRMTIDANGRVLDAIVEESSGHALLDEAAIDAFRRWVFQARTEDDPLVRTLRKRFTFQIR